MYTKETTTKKKAPIRKIYKRSEAFRIPEWEEIKSFFTEDDQACMSSFGIDLWDEESVRENAAAIFDEVSKGRMPPANPWNPYMINSFFKWWKQSTIGTVI